MPKIDAVLVPHMYPPGKVDYELFIARNVEFGPLLGGKRVTSWSVGSLQKDLVAIAPPHGDPPPTYYFPKFHPSHAGQDRYDWTDRGDGVLYGTLVPDPVDAKVLADVAAKALSDGQAAFLASQEAARVTAEAQHVEA